MEFNLNKSMQEILLNYYPTFQMTLDTKDTVGEKNFNYVNAIIGANLKLSVKQAKKAYKKQKRREFWRKIFGKSKTARLEDIEKLLNLIIGTLKDAQKTETAEKICENEENDI